jgi:hypothetical protein
VTLLEENWDLEEIGACGIRTEPLAQDETSAPEEMSEWKTGKKMIREMN